MMPRFSIFSFTPNRYSNNSAVLHRYDIDDGGGKAELLAVEAARELERQGHRIVNVMQNDANQVGGNRRGKRR